MNVVHKINELEPPPPSHTSDHPIAIEPEPPDQQHDIISDEEQQWIDDAIHSATTDINTVLDLNDIDTSAENYPPFVRKLQVKADFGKRLLQAKRRVATKSSLPPPQVHPLHIPTPKSSHAPGILHDTTWRRHECNEWIRNSTGGWDVPTTESHVPPDNPDIDRIATACRATTLPCTESLRIRIKCEIGAN